MTNLPEDVTGCHALIAGLRDIIRQKDREVLSLANYTITKMENKGVTAAQGRYGTELNKLREQNLLQTQMITEYEAEIKFLNKVSRD